MTLKVVLDEQGNVAQPPYYCVPIPEALLRDEARLGYWRAVIKGNPKRIASALKAWSDLLAPRKRTARVS